MLQAISRPDVNRIQSAQVITSLSSATKELVENAIDAGASKISIRFTGYGVDSLEVSDDGPGIPESEFESLVAAHATSKIVSFGDIEGLTTLGFRGEALSALCATSTLVITTCTEETYPMGHTVSFTHDGHLQDKKRVSAQIGTTIRVNQLFSTLPVRRKEFERNAKRDFVKTVKVVQAYAAIQPGIRFDATSLVNTSKTRLVNTTGSHTTKRTLSEVFGTNMSKILVHTSTDLSFKSAHQRKRDITIVRFEGYLSSPQKEYGGQSDRQLTYINARPCHLPRVIKTVNEVYSSLGANRNPFIFLNLTMPTDAYDVNVSPDKRTIFLHDEQLIVDHLRDEIHLLFSNDRRDIPSSTVPIKETQSSNLKPAERLRARFLLDSAAPANETTANSAIQATEEVMELESDDGQETTETDQMNLPDSESSDQVEAGDADNNTAESVNDDDNDNHSQVSDCAKESREVSRVVSDLTSFHRYATQIPSTSAVSPQLSSLKRKRPVQQSDSTRQSRLDFTPTPSKRLDARTPVQDDGSDKEEQPAPEDDTAFEEMDDDVQNLKQEATQDSRALQESPEPLVSSVKPLQRFVPRLKNLDQSNPANHVRGHSIVLNSEAALVRKLPPVQTEGCEAPGNKDLLKAGINDASDVAEQVLTLNVSKTDFFGMTVIGQFNLGFIIVSRNSELFIIDQHASDEKSNYERLIRDTVIQGQRLARPKLLDLSAVEKISLEEHLDTLKKNGFEIELRCSDADETAQYVLMSVPVSKNITFDMSDLQEILDSLIDGVPETAVRCTKAKRMFASRACRSSIMIGTALSKEKMQAVVWHLGEMDAPWNCPHGRPTMRHLTSIASVTKWSLDYD